MNKNLIEIIIPAFNEEDCIQELANRLIELFNREENYDFRVLFIENGSTDSTLDRLVELNDLDSRFLIVKLARNFKMDGGLTAGLHYAAGDAVVFMTADLQDPPELISNFLRLWEQGYKNIFGKVQKRSGINLLRRVNSKLFYALAYSLTGSVIVKGASDFRLLDRVAYENLRELKEKNRFMRGLVSWLGFSSVGVPMVRPERFGGESKAYTFEVIDLAIRGILAHSIKPLRFATLMGLFMFIFSLLAIIIFASVWVLYGVPFAGYGTLIGLILFLFSILFVILGVISEYLGLVYEEVKNRPNFVVEKTFGF